MKKRWIVSVVAAAVAAVVMVTGTAMAAGPKRVDYRPQAIKESARPTVEQKSASEPSPQELPKAETAAAPQAASASGVSCPEHGGNCPSGCTWESGTAAGQTENGGCPYHGTDCPDDCMWSHDGAGCSWYDSSTGTCPKHDGYCHNGSNGGSAPTGNGYHDEDHSADHEEYHDADHDVDHGVNHDEVHDTGHEEDHVNGHNEDHDAGDAKDHDIDHNEDHDTGHDAGHNEDHDTGHDAGHNEDHNGDGQHHGGRHH